MKREANGRKLKLVLLAALLLRVTLFVACPFQFDTLMKAFCKPCSSRKSLQGDRYHTWSRLEGQMMGRHFSISLQFCSNYFCGPRFGGIYYTSGCGTVDFVYRCTLLGTTVHVLFIHIHHDHPTYSSSSLI